jgi:SulP family sulfate permease
MCPLPTMVVNAGCTGKQAVAGPRRAWRPRGHLASDAASGLTQSLALMPDGMAAAALARVSPIHGLTAVMFGPAVGAVFTGAVFMNVSTTAALAAGAREALSGRTDAQALVTLSVLVGLFQLCAGLLRLGRLTHFVSNAVMTGFLTGLGVLVILSQLGDLTGVESHATHRVRRLADLLAHPGRIDPATALVAGATIAGVVVLDRTRLRRLAMLLPLGAVTAGVAILDWRSVALVGAIPRALPVPLLPAPALAPGLLLPALGLAIISLVQGAGVSEAHPNPDGSYADPSRDFVGQGVANLVGGLFRALPVGGSLGGTALAITSGARSRWASVFAGLFAVVATLVFAGLIGRLPLAALSALLVLVGARTIDGARVMLVLRTGWPAALVMIATFAATLALPLHLAVLGSVGLSILVHVWRGVDKVSLRELVIVDGQPKERPAPRALVAGDVTVLLPRGSLFFAGAQALATALPEVGDAEGPIVLLLLRSRKDLGSTFIRVMTRYATALRARHGRLMLVGINDFVMRQLRRTGALAVIGPQNIFPATPRYGEALVLAREAALARLGR